MYFYFDNLSLRPFLYSTQEYSTVADYWTRPNSDLHTLHYGRKPCRIHLRCCVSYRQTKGSILDTVIMLNATPGYNPTSGNILNNYYIQSNCAISWSYVTIRLYGRPPVHRRSSVLSSLFRLPSTCSTAPWLSRNFFLVRIPPAVFLILGYLSIVNRRSFSYFSAKILTPPVPIGALA